MSNVKEADKLKEFLTNYRQVMTAILYSKTQTQIDNQVFLLESLLSGKRNVNDNTLSYMSKILNIYESVYDINHNINDSYTVKMIKKLKSIIKNDLITLRKGEEK